MSSKPNSNTTGSIGLVDPRRYTRIIAVTSGKGGVGKSNVTANLGAALAQQGANVCIFDADTGLANINLILNLKPTGTIADLLSGKKSLDEIIMEGPYGVKVVPGASGMTECVDFDELQKARLLQALHLLERQYDYLIIDTGAGIGNDVLYFVQSAQYALVVISPEPTSLTDAFSLLKVLKRNNFSRPVFVLVNMVLGYENSLTVFKRFAAAVKTYLHIDVNYLGYIQADESVNAAVCKQSPVILTHPDSPASRCFRALAKGLESEFSSSTKSHSFSDYWRGIIHGDKASEPSTQPLGNVVPSVDTTRKETESTIKISDDTKQADTSTQENASPEPKGLQDLFHQLNHVLSETSAPSEEIEVLFAGLIKNFVNRFQHYPLNTRKALYHDLELKDFPAIALREMGATLEHLYESRHQQPFHDLESGTARLFAKIGDNKQQLEELGQQVEARLKRRFDSPSS